MVDSLMGTVQNPANMKRSFSISDLELLGYTDPKHEKSEKWDIFSAVAVAGLERRPATFLYLKADFTNDDVKRVSSTIAKLQGPQYVIIPKSEAKRQSFLKNQLGSDVKTYLYEDLIWEKVRNTFDEYLTALASTIPQEKYYVPPRRERAPSQKTRLDEEILGYLASENDDVDRAITVVRAPAGVGKTTLARYITKTLADNVAYYQTIPIHVESSHWGKLQLASLEDLWELIDNSLRRFSPNFRITESLFQHLLRQGYLAFIFDGFDELCEQRHAPFTPREVLEELLTVSKESLAKVILTTRTIFWDAAIGSEKLDVRIFDLASFNRLQAIDYFRNVFKKSTSDQHKASALYDRLVKSAKPLNVGGSRQQFVNHPYCVQMISECVRLGSETTFEFEAEKSLIFQFLRHFCERERLRQGLTTRAETQLEAFQEIAVSDDSSGFDLALCSAAGFDERDLPRMKDHPLLDIKPAQGRQLYTFRYDFLPDLFRARYVVSLIRKAASGEIQITQSDFARRIMSEEAKGKGNILERMLQFLGVDDAKTVARCYRATSEAIGKPSPELSFLFHILRVLIETPNMTKSERALNLFNVLTAGKFQTDHKLVNLYVVGQIDKFDLSDVVFVESVFSDASFTDCIVNGNTCFDRCRFSGQLEILGSDRKAWKGIQLRDCTLEFPTNLVWDEFIGTRAANKEDHVKDAMRLALGKFWHHGQAKLTIDKAHWSKGTLGHSMYCMPLLDAMLRAGILQEIHISGLPQGGYLFSKSALVELQRFMDNGQVTGKLRDVYKVLMSK